MSIFESSPALTSARRVPAFDVIGWILRIGAAALFLGVGSSKFDSHSLWVRIFAEIGLGDWFRYLTGAIQVAAGLLFLIPRAIYGAALLAGGTMAGAIVTHLFVLHTGIHGALIPFIVLIFVAVVTAYRSSP